MDGAMDATMLTRWCYDKDKGDVDATMTRTTLKVMRLQGCDDKGQRCLAWCYGCYNADTMVL